MFEDYLTMSINLKEIYSQQQKARKIRKEAEREAELVRQTDDLIIKIRTDIETNNLSNYYHTGPKDNSCSRNTVRYVTNILEKNSFTGFKVSCHYHHNGSVLVQLD